jgi:farnesyl-diphosphate farnesyltransferase
METSCHAAVALTLQVMAVATLALCYNNAGVFTGVVKIRKGLAVRMILDSTSMDNVMMVFDQHLNEVQAAIPDADPTAAVTRDTVDKGLKVRKPDGCCIRCAPCAWCSPLGSE